MKNECKKILKTWRKYTFHKNGESIPKVETIKITHHKKLFDCIFSHFSAIIVVAFMVATPMSIAFAEPYGPDHPVVGTQTINNNNGMVLKTLNNNEICYDKNNNKYGTFWSGYNNDLSRIKKTINMVGQLMEKNGLRF